MWNYSYRKRIVRVSYFIMERVGSFPPALFLILKVMDISKIASAVLNDVEAGLSGMNANLNISIEQLEDEVIEQRESIIKEWYLKGVLKPHDLMLAINCMLIVRIQQSVVTLVLQKCILKFLY